VDKLFELCARIGSKRGHFPSGYLVACDCKLQCSVYLPHFNFEQSFIRALIGCSSAVKPCGQTGCLYHVQLVEWSFDHRDIFRVLMFWLIKSRCYEAAWLVLEFFTFSLPNHYFRWCNGYEKLVMRMMFL
jgi:hypothetical protein